MLIDILALNLWVCLKPFNEPFWCPDCFVFAELLRSCFRPLGLSKGRIRNRQLKASSSWDRNHSPSRARLNLKKQGSRIGAWASRHKNRNQWLMIDIGHPTRVTKIATQGRDDANQFVRSYYLYFSQNGGTWHAFKEGRKIKVRIITVLSFTITMIMR